ncbi:MAG: VanZ family protein [Oscillospiraceae bacterium]|nr:VanZ family protein [Oscillospiraceae bacterium]
MIRRTDRRMQLCAALLTVNLLFIWGNSLMPASVSGTLSQWVRDLISLIFSGSSEGGQGDGLLRKLAHFGEFCCLGACLSWLTGMCMKTIMRSAGLSLACGFAAACADEALQHLSPGRAPRITDVGIDTAGVAVGIILLWAGYLIHQRTKIFGGKQT